MRTPTRRARTLCALIVLACLCAAGTTAGPSPGGSAAGLRIEPSKTWVGIARVHLEVDELRLLGDELVGDYRIRIPIRPSENDFGTIRLTPVESVDRFRQGGEFAGSAVSDYGKVHSLACEVRPDGTVTIEVISAKRTMSFNTTYHVTARR